MDHRQSYRDQDVQNGQSASHKAGAGPLPAQGEPLTVFIHRRCLQMRQVP